MQRESKMIRCLVAVILFFGFQFSSQAQVSVSTDRTIISEYETVTLTLQVTGDVDEAPDFSVIRDFTIISQQQRSETSMNISGGKREIKSTRIYNLALEPKRVGKLLIPKFRVGRNTTEEILIDVTAHSAENVKRDSRFAFFETKVDKPVAYVQSQIIYSVKLYYTNAISGDFPAAPEIPNTIIESLDSDIRDESVINGQRFSSLEKHYAIFPQKSGNLRIPQEKFRGMLGRGSFFNQGRTIAVTSKPIDVSVKPVPEEFTGSSWIAAKAFALEENWSEYPPKFKMGEPISRIINMEANGITKSQFPQLDQRALDTAKTYVDPPLADERLTKEGILSSNRITIGIVPTQADSITFGEIKIPWWNTNTDREEIALIPSRTFEIESIEYGDMPSTEKLPLTIQTETPTTPQNESVSWPMIFLIIGLTVYSVFSSLQWQQKNKELSALKVLPSEDSKTHRQPNEMAAFDKLRQACLVHNAADAHHFLLLWSRSKFSVNSLQELQNQYKGSELKLEIARLEQALYAKEKISGWRGNDLLTQVNKLKDTLPKHIESAHLMADINPTTKRSY